MSKTEKHIEYYPNGKKKAEDGGYKDGQPDGKWTEWYEDGQKKGEINFKDGYLDGLQTFWYENGQKYLERTFKDGKFISEKMWDEDGMELFLDTDGEWYASGSNK